MQRPRHCKQSWRLWDSNLFAGRYKNVAVTWKEAGGKDEFSEDGRVWFSQLDGPLN